MKQRARGVAGPAAGRRTRLPVHRRRVALIVSALLASTSTAEPAPTATRGAESVILLHGLGRSADSMEKLGERLSEQGFVVYNFSYPSRDEAPAALVARLHRAIETCCADARTVHFVGHSLGGILARAYLAEDPPANAGRLVMLGPPNRGSEIVDLVGDTALFEWIMGPTAIQLGTEPGSFPNRLPAPRVEVGVIAGTETINPIGSVVLPGEDDGMVSVAHTKLDGMADFIAVEANHAFIMRSSEVARQVVRFLREGRFDHGRTNR